MSSTNFAARQRRTFTAWVLVAGVLLQPLLTYLVTPWFAEDARGHVVFVCTLNGLKAVSVDDSPLDLETAPDEESCPALTLVQLAETARIATPLAVPTFTLYVTALRVAAGDHQHHPRHSTLYSSRAPPVV